MTSTAPPVPEAPARRHRAAVARARAARRPLPRLAGRVALAALVAGVGSAVLQQTADLLVIPRPSFVPAALAATAAATLVVLLAVLVLRRGPWPRWGDAAACLLLSAVPTAVLAFMLHGSRLYLNGLSGDQFFRTQYLTRLVASGWPADMNYADVPPYYPWGWFWPAARATDLLGLEAWSAYKPLAITTVAVAAALSFTAWSVLVSRRAAVLLGLATALVGLRLAAYEPYSWLLAAVIPPVGVIVWRELHAAAAGRARSPHVAVALGVFVGLTAAVYTLLTAFLAFLALLVAAAAVLTARGRGRATGAAAGSTARRVLLVAAVSVPFALPVWAPYLLASVRDGFRAGAAQHFLPEVGAVFPLPMFAPSLSGAVCLAGLAWILAAAHRSDVAAGLGAVVVAVYGWYLLSTLALAAGTTLLAFRVEPVLEAALYCAAVLGAAAAVRRARAGALLPARPLVTAAGAVGLLVTVGLAQGSWEVNRAFAQTAFTDYTPLGVPASGVARPTDAGAWADELATAIGDLSGRAPDDLVVLTTYYPLLAHDPYWGYQTSIAQYANPLADYDRRLAEIEDWARADDPRDLLDRIDSGPFQPPSVLVLRRAPGELRLDLTADGFPREPNIIPVEVDFDPALFSSPAFVRRDVGPFAVIVRR